MKLYCHVRDGSIGDPRPLPTEWEGMLNFHLHPRPEDHGWLKLVDTALPRGYDQSRHQLTEQLSVENGRVVRRYGLKARPIPVPPAVPAWKMLAELDNQGYAVGMIPEKLRGGVLHWFNRAPEWERSSMYVTIVTDVLGINDGVMDSVFIAADRRGW